MNTDQPKPLKSCPFCGSEAAVPGAPALAQQPEEKAGQSGDAERLDWLLRNISGKALRDIGITYSSGCTREDIDKARSGAARKGEGEQ